MLRRLTLPVVTLALLVAAYAVPAAPANDEQAIRAAYAKLDAAFVRGDTKTIAASATPDFTYTQPNGRTLKLDAVLAGFKQQQAQGIRVVAQSSKLDKVTVKGTTATVVTRATSTAALKGPDGKTHTLKATSAGTDVLVKTGGVWKFRTVKVASEKMLMDGKPFNPGMMAPPSRPGPGRRTRG